MATLITESQLAQLSMDERVQLLELVLNSLSPDELPAPSWHDAIIDERVKRMEADPQPGIAWADAREMLRKRRAANARTDS